MPPSPRPRAPLAVLRTGWPPKWCWAVSQPKLFVATGLQTLLMDCDGPDFRVYAVHGEGRGEKDVSWVRAAGLGLHWGSFRTGI